MSNLHHFSGRVEYVKERRAPKQAWGSLNARIVLSRNHFTFKEEQKTISNSTLWLTIKTEYENDILSKRCKAVLESCQKGRFIFVNGAKISDFVSVPKDEQGKPIPNAPTETRYSIEVGASACSFADVPYRDINISLMNGTVKEQGQNGMLKISMPYSSKDGLKFKEGIVFSPFDFDHSLIGKRVFVAGQLFGKTPTKVDQVYVVADTLEIIK